MGIVFSGRLPDFFQSLRAAVEKAQTVGEALGSSVGKELNYFLNNESRIHYSEYLAQGYLIGSGAMEGSCKHHVKERIDRAGMHWSPDGAMSVLRNRTLIRNDDWETFWLESARRRWVSYGTLRRELAA